MDKNSMGTHHPLLSINFMYHHLLHNVKFPTHPYDTHRNLHLLRHFLEFFPIRIQMCSYLQNNLHQLLCSRTNIRHLRFHLLDNRTFNV